MLVFWSGCDYGQHYLNLFKQLAYRNWWFGQLLETGQFHHQNSKILILISINHAPNLQQARRRTKNLKPNQHSSCSIISFRLNWYLLLVVKWHWKWVRQQYLQDASDQPLELREQLDQENWGYLWRLSPSPLSPWQDLTSIQHHHKHSRLPTGQLIILSVQNPLVQIHPIHRFLPLRQALPQIIHRNRTFLNPIQLIHLPHPILQLPEPNVRPLFERTHRIRKVFLVQVKLLRVPKWLYWNMSHGLHLIPPVYDLWAVFIQLSKLFRAVW